MSQVTIDTDKILKQLLDISIRLKEREYLTDEDRFWMLQAVIALVKHDHSWFDK